MFHNDTPVSLFTFTFSFLRETQQTWEGRGSHSEAKYRCCSSPLMVIYLATDGGFGGGSVGTEPTYGASETEAAPPPHSCDSVVQRAGGSVTCWAFGFFRFEFRMPARAPY